MLVLDVVDVGLVVVVAVVPGDPSDLTRKTSPLVSLLTYIPPPTPKTIPTGRKHEVGQRVVSLFQRRSVKPVREVTEAVGVHAPLLEREPGTATTL